MLTLNGRLTIARTRWHGPTVGSRTVLDGYLDRAERTVSVGVREMACRLNGGGTDFDRTADNPFHATHARASGETLRQLIEDEGKQVLTAFRDGTLPITWTAEDCPAEAGVAGSPTRVYFGCDGVMGPDGDRRREGEATRENQGETAAV